MKQILVIVLAISLVSGLDNGVGLTPPMGWNSWNHFGCYINETIIKTTADLLVRTGLAAKGYKYVNLDDCWQVHNEVNGRRVAIRTLMKSLLTRISQVGWKRWVNTSTLRA
jgi:hypothetical protein